MFTYINLKKKIFDSKRDIHLKKINGGGHLHNQSILKKGILEWDVKPKIN